MRNVIVLAGLLVLGAIICSTTWKPLKAEAQGVAESGPRPLAERAMEQLRRSDVEGMMEELREQLIYSPASFEVTRELCSSQREGMVSRYGEATGEIELVRTQEIGQSFVRFIYIERFEKHAMVWRLGYYRSAEGWRLNEFEWDDKVKQLYTAVE